MNFIYFFDLLGTFTFAASGALLGVKKNFDIYGLFVLAFSVAVGGGTIRDMMLGVKPFILYDPAYIACTVFAVAAVALYNRKIYRQSHYLLILDAIGLGVFTVIGAAKAVDAGISWYGVVLMGALTGTGGGMIRDVLAREVPVVLKNEIYASASMLGVFLFLLLEQTSVSRNLSAVAVAVFVAAVRIITLEKNIHLPRLRGGKKGKQR